VLQASLSPDLMKRIDQDVERIGELQRLDVENELKAQKLAAMEKTVADLQARLDAALAAAPSSGAKVSREGAGRIEVQLQGELVFATGSARITRAGRAALGRIAAELKQPTVKRVVVEGHTDAVPVGRKYEDNWQLSAERARRVVAFLASLGVTRRMVASGFADSAPLVAGDDAESRRKNRRVEIFIETSSE
jgi:chemotaxis protein MotB